VASVGKPLFPSAAVRLLQEGPFEATFKPEIHSIAVPCQVLGIAKGDPMNLRVIPKNGRKEQIVPCYRVFPQ
jgi:hypothetical protein